MFADPKLYGIETMTLDQQIEHLTDLCKQERARGLQFLRNHTETYSEARHRGYVNLLKQAMAARDIEAIDKAFERAGQRILEAAE